MVAAPGLVGSRLKRKEDPRLLRGASRYVDDIRLEGMKYAAFVRSSVAHAPEIADTAFRGGFDMSRNFDVWGKTTITATATGTRSVRPGSPAA